MTGPKFHETGYGRRFFDKQLPDLIKSISDLAAETKRANDLNESEQMIKTNLSTNQYT